MLSKDAGTFTKCHKNIFLAIIPEQNKDILGRPPFKNKLHLNQGSPCLFSGMGSVIPYTHLLEPYTQSDPHRK